MKYEKVRSLQHTRGPLREIEHALVNPEIKVRELALLALSSILQHPDFPEDVLESFRRISYSRKVFGLSYPLLIRKREWSRTMPYYANYLRCKRKYYCLCSAWSELHREQLVAWVTKHKIDIDESRTMWQLDRAPRVNPESTGRQTRQNSAPHTKYAGRAQQTEQLGSSSYKGKKVQDIAIHELMPKRKRQTVPLKIQITVSDSERQYVKIQDSAILNKKSLCRFVNEAAHTTWEIASKALIAELKEKRIDPIVFMNEGRFWTFYLDAQTGKVYKSPSDNRAILQLKRT